MTLFRVILRMKEFQITENRLSANTVKAKAKGAMITTDDKQPQLFAAVFSDHSIALKRVFCFLCRLKCTLELYMMQFTCMPSRSMKLWPLAEAKRMEGQ